MTLHRFVERVVKTHHRMTRPQRGSHHPFKAKPEKTTDAFIACTYIDKLIIVVFSNHAAWAYPGESWEYAIMHRMDVSAGKYFNKVLRPRGGVKVRDRET